VLSGDIPDRCFQGREVMGIRVLLAEDDPAVSASIAEQLRGLGHEVVGEAGSGREAVRLALEAKPDLVVMDIKMPDGDGIEAACRIAEERPVAVVFLSGHYDEELLCGVVESGGLAYLLKPATSDQLQAVLGLAHRRFQEMRDLKEQTQRLAEALEVRKLVARAKGLLMERHGIGEKEAHRRLQKEASRSNMKLADLSRAILAAEPFVGDHEG
jgi:AmiR/NasT family two-component response regulator